MKTRKTKKRNIIRRTVAFLLCMTMVLGLGMQDVIEQVYAEEAMAQTLETQAADTEVAAEESTAPAEEETAPEETVDPAETPAEENLTEETTETPSETPSVPSEPAEDTDTDTDTERGENEQPSTPAGPAESTTPADDVQNGSGSETSGETGTEEETDGKTQAPNEDDAAVTNPDETAGDEAGDDKPAGDTEETTEETTEPAEEEQKPVEEEAQAYDKEETVGNVTIHVYAEAGVLPEDAELSVTPIEKKEITEGMSEEEKAKAEEINAQYDETEQKLVEEVGVAAPADSEESENGITVMSADEAASDSAENETDEKVLEGFLAYDISFLVTDEEGNESEIEPDGEVKVSFEFDEAVIPENVSEDAEVSVAHLKEEKKDNGDTEIVVENLTESNGATVTADENAAVTGVELTTDSFSVFTIYWSKDRNNRNLEIRVVDQAGYNIGTDSVVRLDANSEKTVEEIASEITVPEGYSFDKAVIGRRFSYDNSQVDRLRYSSWSDYQGRNEYFDAQNTWKNVEDQTIWFIYKQIPANITIEDDIAGNIGLLIAQPDNDLEAQIEGAESEGKSIKYVWSKSENGGEYKEVTLLRSAGNNYNLQGEYYEKLDIVIDGADKANKTKYKVEVFIGDDATPAGTSAEFVVPYYRDIQNGGFEDVLSDKTMTYPENGPTDANKAQWSNDNYKYWGGVWQTTGVGGQGKTGQDIEILNVNGEVGGKEQFMYQLDSEDIYAADAETGGKQYAEINCETSGALYQDVLTDTEIDLQYFLSHRARSCEAYTFGEWYNKDQPSEKFDTMYLVIMPSADADKYNTNHGGLVDYLNSLLGEIEIPKAASENNNNKEEATVIYNNNDGESGVFIARITSDASNWHFITSAEISTVNGVSRTYRPISSLSRFFFISGATYSNNNTVGNLVDAISFGQNTVAPVADKVTINIGKTVTGLTEEEFNALKEQLQFKITATDPDTGAEVDTAPLSGTISATDSNWTWKVGTADSEGNVTITGSYTASEDINYTNKYLYKIEEIGAELDGYTLNYSLTIEAEEEENGGAILGNQDAARFSFTNAYTSAAKKDVTFTKIWNDDGNRFGTRPKDLTVVLSATVTAGGEKIELKPEDLGLSSFEQIINEEDNKVGSDTDRWRATWKDVPVYYVYEGQKLPIEYTVAEKELSTEYVYNASEVRKGDGSSYTESNMTDFSNVMSPKSGTPSITNSISAAAANGENDELGAPAHRKYITYDKSTGKYTLNLDVTGKKGDAEGVDILFVIDNSPSMAGDWYWEEGLIDEVQKLLTGGSYNPDDGIIDQIFAADGNVNSVAYVQFGGSAYSDNTWYTSDNKSSLEKKINELKANNSSTNWKAAMEKADEVLRRRAQSENEKVVIFLSDGEPNAGGYGSSYNTESHCNAAIQAVKNSDYLKRATIYSVYLNEDSEDMMDNFATGVGGTLVDGTRLSEALTGILQMIIPEYKNVVIHDTLTDWVDPVSKSDITVWKKTANSSEVKLDDKDYNVTVTNDGKNIEVQLLNGDALDDGATYTIKFEVSPSQAAIDDYAENGEYPNRGGANTNTDNQLGYFTNVSARVEYKVNGQQDTKEAPYNTPVIQVPEPSETDITIRKVWDTNDDSTIPDTIDVVLYRRVNGNTPSQYEKYILKASEGWTVTFEDCPLRDGENKYSYSVEEAPVPEGYTSWIETKEDSSGNLTFTITNTYDQYSVDENYYIVNTLQTDELQVTKNWSGDDQQQDLRKPVTIRIFDSLNQTYDVSLDADTGWTKTIVVPRLLEVGYKAVELNVPENYEASQASITGENGVYNVSVTNTLQTISIDVKKVWEDGDLKLNHTEVEFKVQQYDETAGEWVDTGKTGTLNAENNWSTTITGLKAGFTYQVVETNVPSGYKGVTIQNDVNSYVITNTLQWSMVKTDKLLAGEEESNRSYLSGAEFELQTLDKQRVAYGTSSEATETRGVIEWKFEGEVNLNGEYKIVETKAPDGYQINEDGWTVEFKNGIPVKFDGEIITSDDVKKDGIVLILENEMLYELPSTGGPGIYLYMLGGTLLMMAGTLLVYKKRKEEVLRG